MNDTVVKRRRASNLILTILGSLLLIFTITLGVYDFLEEQKGITVYATIVSIESKGSSYTADVTYKVENKTYEQKKIPISTKSELAIGDSVPIKYDLNNPSRLIHNNHIIILLITGLLSIIILIINLPKFISNLKRNSRVKKLIKAANVINANIQEVYINNRGKKNGEYFPYRLRCRYTNPQNNATYVYDSEDCYINLNQVITTYNMQTVKVYIDTEVATNYYVDLDSLIPNINVIDPRAFMSAEAAKKKAAAEAEKQAATQAAQAEETPAPATSENATQTSTEQK